MSFVTVLRMLALSVGPPLLIGGAYALSFPAAHREQVAFEARIAEAESRSARHRHDELEVLTEACRQAADEILSALPAGSAAVVHTPFVIAGDCSAAELDRLHGQTIVPISEALWRAYFDQRPDQPVVIVAMRDEAGFRETARRLDGYEPAAYAGYTQRNRRRIVFNASTGSGTLTHELSHVLALFDFPEMPEWFDEGLAALYEESSLSPDGLLLSGSPNWRSRILADALRGRQLPSLGAVVRSHTFRGDGENLNYALVRGLCLYLQERGLLPHFYRKFRANVDDDPSGLATLCELLEARRATEVERDFHRWIANPSSR